MAYETASAKKDDVAKSPEDVLALLKGQYDEWFEATRTGRAAAERCRDYRDGKQWTQDELDTLKARGQPAIVDNKIADKCDTLLGIERQMRTDPKAFPRTPKHEEDSEAATDALRFVADDNVFQRAVRQRCADNLMVEGLTAVEIVVEKYKGQKHPKVCVRHIRWDRVFYDVHSLLPDFSDKRYAGFSTWMDLEAAQENPAWKGKSEFLTDSKNDSSTADGSAADKPTYTQTVRNRTRLRIVTHFLIHEGVWKRAVWCSGGILEELAPSDYLDEHREPECCVEIQSAYRDRDGCPYGPVSNWIDRQDEINKRRSKMMHLLNTKQIIAPKGSFPDTEDGKSGIQIAREQVHKPDGVIEYADGYQDKVDIRTNEQLAEGQWRLLVETINSLSTTGPNEALQGQSGSNSGIAKQVDQQAGSLLVAPLFESLSALQLRVYRQMWNRIRQFWTAEIWIRVTDDENNVKFVSLNRPMKAGEIAQKKINSLPASDEQKAALLEQAMAHPGAQGPALDERGSPVLEHPVAEMDVDIILEEAPDIVNVQQQEFAMIAEVAKARPEVPFEVLLELSQMRSQTKKRVLDKISGADNPQAQQMAALQEQMQQLALALQAANVRKAEAEAHKSEAAASESEVDATVKVAEFVTPQPKPAGKTQVTVN